MHQIYISLPFFINSSKRQEFYDFCKKRKIQIIKEVDNEKKLVAWEPTDYYYVSVRFKDTAKFDLNTDKEFYKFVDQRGVLFFRLIVSGKYDKKIEVYELKYDGEFTKRTQDWYNINHSSMVDLGWVINQTCHFGVDALYVPEKEQSVAEKEIPTS